jgi:hypothetical protein
MEDYCMSQKSGGATTVKITGFIFVFLILVSKSVFAISPMNLAVIEEAQTYGKTHAQVKLEEFLLPWISYEEKTPRLNESSERAYLYTNFLLIATDAREKSLNGLKPQLEDSEKILTNYNGFLTFSVMLYGTQPKFAQSAIVELKQGNTTIKAQQITIPDSAEKALKSSDKPTFRSQCYFYFATKGIAFDKPITLSIVTKDQKNHNFYFDFAHIK